MAQRMDKKLFKSIGDVPNARESWMFVSDTVVSELIGNDVFSLPHIQDGSHYKLGDIILQEKSLKDRRILRKTPSAIRAGCLTGFLKPSDNDNQVTSTFQNRYMYQYRNADFNPNFVWVKETTRKGIKKSIRVEVEGCIEVYLTNIPDENSLFRSLNKGFLDFFTKFYLISTLYRAQKVRIVIRINDQTDEYITSSPDVTIGFKLHRYKFDKDIKAPSEKCPKKLKIKIMPRFLFPGFTMDRQPPIPSETPNHDQEPEMREHAHNDLN